MTSSAAAILIYWWCVPTILYLLSRWRQNKSDISYLEMLCIYGYSLSIYIPISILWLVQISSIQWILVIISFTLSGGVLVLTFSPIFSNDKINVIKTIINFFNFDFSF